MAQTHKVQVYSYRPFAASIPPDLTACEDSLSVEKMEKAVLKGRCSHGHPIEATGP
jgi:hypothetical protein